MPTKIHFFPLGNADTLRLDLADGRKVLVDFADNRLGEANVLLGLGELERGLGRNEQARTAYDEAAQLFGSLGMMNYRDEALHGASLASTR